MPVHCTSLCTTLPYKSLFLVAAASAHRSSELCALTTKEGYLCCNPSGVRMLLDPSFLTKNQSALITPAAIFLPYISSLSPVQDRQVCPVRALKWYLERTKPVRTSPRLFLVPRFLFHPASQDSLPRWLVKIISSQSKSSGHHPRAHDIRAVATSEAWFRGVPIEDIIKAACWKTPSTFVACYLTQRALH